MEDKLLNRLLNLGYSRFKVLNQTTYTDKMPVFEHEVLPRLGPSSTSWGRSSPPSGKYFPGLTLTPLNASLTGPFPKVLPALSPKKPTDDGSRRTKFSYGMLCCGRPTTKQAAHSRGTCTLACNPYINSG